MLVSIKKLSELTGGIARLSPKFCPIYLWSTARKARISMTREKLFR
jgi:hypothetical protein